MSESSAFRLTGAQIISSLLGYCGLGVAIACFIPLILQNAAQRRNGTGGLFLATWLCADALNMAGLVLTHAPISQCFLAGWYGVADVCLGIELWKFGHPEPWPFPWHPTPAATLGKKRDAEHKSKFILNFDRQFESWGLWDNFKVVTAFIFVGIAWWGIFIVASLFSKKGDFEIEIPMSHSKVAIGLGCGATILFTGARFPELWHGMRRHSKKQKPTSTLDDGMYFFLIIENCFNLASILVLSLDPSLDAEGRRGQYFLGEAPWIAGAIFPITIDTCLVVGILTWQRAWNKRPYSNEPDKATRLHKIEIDLDRNEVERLHLVEQKENVEVENDAFDHHQKIMDANEKRKTKGKVTDGLRERIGSPKKPQESRLLKDYNANATRLFKEKSKNRLKLDGFDEKYGPRHLLSSEPESSEEYSSGEEAFSPPTRSRSTRDSIQSSPSSIRASSRPRV